jgi:hypothetical protein
MVLRILKEGRGGKNPGPKQDPKQKTSPRITQIGIL